MANKFDESLFEDKPFDGPDESLFEDVPFEGPEEISGAEAVLEGSKQGLTFGASDELSGALGAVMEGVAMTPEEGESRLEQLQRVYGEYRDVARQRADRAEEAQPGAFLAGDLGASFLTPAGLIGGAAKAGGKAVAKQAAKVGTATGALEAAGRTEEDLTSLEGLGDVGISAAAGGALGVGVGSLVSKLGSKRTPGALSQAAEQTEKEASESALKSIGARAKDIIEERGLAKSKRKDQKLRGKTLLDKNVLRIKQTTEEAQEAIEKQLDDVAINQIKKFSEEADVATREIPLREFTPEVEQFRNKISGDLEKVAESALFAKSNDKLLYKNMEETTQKLSEEITNALESPNRISKLTDIKRKLQKQVNWKDAQAEGYNKYLMGLQADVSSLIDNMTQKTSPELANKLKTANREYANLLKANEIATKEAGREAVQGAGISIKDIITGGAISGAANIRALGPVVIGGKRLAEKITGKETGKLLNQLEAFQKAKKSKDLSQRALSPSKGDVRLTKDGEKLAEEVTGRTAQVGAVALDEQDLTEPYNKDRAASNLFKTAEPEEIREAATDIRQKYGKDGERLASTLEKTAERDKMGRQALIFSLMQDPANRKMLGLMDEE